MRSKTMVLLLAGMLTALACMASATETITYTYDAKGRLVRVAHSGTVNNNVISNYSYDASDNRKNVKVTGAP